MAESESSLPPPPQEASRIRGRARAVRENFERREFGLELVMGWSVRSFSGIRLTGGDLRRSESFGHGFGG